MFDFYSIQRSILEGSMSTDQQICLFTELEGYTFTSLDFENLLIASREKMIQVCCADDSIDIVGTGGDTFDTINISTLAMVVAASCGAKVAKHGNRGVTSKVGSSNILESLGVNIMLNSDQAAECLESTGLVFLFAPLFNPAFIHAKEARGVYGKKTYFNLIGPMCNPCNTNYSLVGLYDFTIAKIMAKCMLKSGSRRVIVVHGTDGINEVSPIATTQIYDTQSGYNELVPTDLIDIPVSYDEIESGDLDYNSTVSTKVLQGTASPGQIASVCINSGTALYICGKVPSIKEGIELSIESTRSGKAWETFCTFRDFTRQYI
jgi:anthranilate phosphoribosyltransferase